MSMPTALILNAHSANRYPNATITKHQQHKSVPTCTLSLASATAGAGAAPTEFPVQVPVTPFPTRRPSSSLANPHPSTPHANANASPRRPKTSMQTSGETNYIPFPRTFRPLPVPPSIPGAGAISPHALLRQVFASTLPPSAMSGRVTPPVGATPPRSRRASLTPGSIPRGALTPLAQAQTPREQRAGLKADSRLSSPSRGVNQQTGSVPKPMQRRTSRDPNVADHLVVEDDDSENRPEAQIQLSDIPPRPSSPTPSARQQTRHQLRSASPPLTSPTSPTASVTAPPAYSTLPPPYSALSDYEDKKDAVVVEEDVGLDCKVQVEQDQQQVEVMRRRSPSPPAQVQQQQRTPKTSMSLHPPSPSPSPSPSSSSGSSSSSSASSSSSSHQRHASHHQHAQPERKRVSTSELKVLVYLYRTVAYGLQMRKQAQAAASAAASPVVSPLPSIVCLPATTPMTTAPTTTKKPAGPRSTPLPIPIPSDKASFERTLAGRFDESARRGFGRFVLVEEDEDASSGSKVERGCVVEDDDDSEEDHEKEKKGNREYVVPKTPAHTPSVSPRASSPVPLSTVSPVVSVVSGTPTPTPTLTTKGKSKAEITAELDVQDALLMIRLKEFLEAQGVCAGDLELEPYEGAFEEGDVQSCASGSGSASASASVNASTGASRTEEEEVKDDGEVDILEGYFSGVEDESDEVRTEEPLESPFVEDELDESPKAAPAPAPSPTPLTVKVPPSTSSLTSNPKPNSELPAPSRTTSPPPPSPSPKPRAVVELSYMVALLTMRNRYAAPAALRGGKKGERKRGGDCGRKEKERKGGVCVEVD